MSHVLVGVLALPIGHQAQLQTRLESLPMAKNISAFDACSAPLHRQAGQTLRCASSPAEAGRPLHPPPVKGARLSRRSPCDEPR
jgi:hypothetical protein